VAGARRELAELDRRYAKKYRALQRSVGSVTEARRELDGRYAKKYRALQHEVRELRTSLGGQS